MMLVTAGATSRKLQLIQESYGIDYEEK